MDPVFETILRKKADPQLLQIIPAGGVGEFGMNVTVYIHNSKVYLVDCGAKFPEPFRLGVDLIIPDLNPLLSALGGVHAYLITHGHEDHIGSLPYMLDTWPAPLYGTPWTLALIRNKLLRLQKNPQNYDMRSVEAGYTFEDGPFKARYVHVNHSIPHATALWITTQAGSVFHTGDFKLDPNPVLEAPYSVQDLRAIGDQGVDLLCADSTNADKPGRCPSENLPLETCTQIMEKAPQAVIATLFASNLWRIKILLQAAHRSGRKVGLLGAGIQTTLGLAKELGLYSPPEKLILDDNSLAQMDRRELVLLATGCQGEPRSALYRLSKGDHRSYSLTPDDTVLYSARLIPGNERQVINMFNEITKRGVHILTTKEHPDIHVSGHAYKGDLEHLQELLRPKHFIPIHGHFSQLLANTSIPKSHLHHPEGTDGNESLVLNGRIITLSQGKVELGDALSISTRFVDEGGLSVISDQTLRDRLKIGSQGLVLVSGVYQSKKSKNQKSWLEGVTFDFTGLEPPEKSGPINKLQQNVQSFVEKGMRGDDLMWAIRRLFFERLGRKPIVKVLIHYLEP